MQSDDPTGIFDGSVQDQPLQEGDEIRDEILVSDQGYLLLVEPDLMRFSVVFDPGRLINNDMGRSQQAHDAQ